MKLTKEQILIASRISATDASMRLAEFQKYKNLEPNKKNYDIEKIREIFPNAQYFDIGSIEGLYGQIDDYLFITFRGSDSLIDWIKNFIFFKKVIPYEGTNPKIRVHAGFLKSYKQVRNVIQHIIKSSGLKKVIFFGHSKGASLATLGALDCQYNFKEIEVGCFVIGSPRIGNQRFKESLERRLPDYIRCDHGSDLIPQLPPELFGYKHLDKFYQLGEKRKTGLGTHKDHDWLKYDLALNDEIDKLFTA